ncbi:MAG: hypothetical protein ACR2RB_17410 [Gammaproteobacteria bacterium]
MDARVPVDFDPQQVSLFLEKIAQDCDTELRDIAGKRDAEIARIRGDAYAESHRLFRRSAEQLCARLVLERGRYLARVRSDLRRKKWKILVESQQRALKAVSDRFWNAWEVPDRQWEWSQYWLELARERAGDNTIQITLGKGALENVRARIEETIRDHPAGASVTIDTDTDPGIRIEWGDYVLDGRLTSQSTAITDAVLSRLSNLLHEQDGECSQ